MKTLDCRTQKCPYPVVETRKLLISAPGTPLTVLVGDDIARENVTRLAAGQGYEVTTSVSEGGYTLLLSPAKAPAEAPRKGIVAQEKTVVFITGDQMGRGSEELGRILLKNFLFTMAEAEMAPDLILFVNAGVKLTTRGSEVLEALEKLGCMGTDIASCGLCLDFYHLKDQLAAGRSTNMLEIAQALQEAGRIIQP